MSLQALGESGRTERSKRTVANLLAGNHCGRVAATMTSNLAKKIHSSFFDIGFSWELTTNDNKLLANGIDVFVLPRSNAPSR
jgi:hypothetical protein